MDKRLSGVLAWGALIIILGIPGADVVNRRMSASDSQANGVTTPEVQPTPEAVPEEVAETSLAPHAEISQPDLDASPPPAESIASAVPENLRGGIAVPDDATVAPASQPPPVMPETETAVVDMPLAEAVPSFSDVTVLPPATPSVVSLPNVAEYPSVANAASSGSSAIAARVREVLLSGGSSGSSGAVTTLPDAVAATETANAAPTSVIASVSADTTFTLSTYAQPEAIPYPTSAEARPRTPVVIATSQPQEPVPEIRPDNAIFFRNWAYVPPLAVGSGNGN